MHVARENQIKTIENLNRRISQAMQNRLRSQDLDSISSRLNLSIEAVRQISIVPVRVPLCDLVRVLECLELTAIMYEPSFFRFR